MRTSGGPVPNGYRDLSVVIPCFNEASTLKVVLERVLASPYTGEVVVVDDGSSDGSGDIARSIGDARVTVFAHGVNLGKGSAVRLGLQRTTRPYVIIQDADLEYAPELYGQLLEPILSGDADVVMSSRFGQQAGQVMYFWQSTGNRLLTLLSDSLTNLNLSDVMSGPKVLRRAVVDELEIEQDRFGVEPEIVAKCAEAGWHIYEVTIPYDGGTGDRGGKQANWRAAVGSVYSIVRYSAFGKRLAKPRARYERESARTEFVEADHELASTLDSLDDAGNYADWIVSLIAPYLGADTVEIGAGHGTMSARLRRHTRVTATELSARAAAKLRERFAGDAAVTVVEGDVDAAMAAGPYDSAVMINVLEHIEDDEAVLRSIHDGLRPGGTLAVFVPAYEALYSEFDRKIGHFRRYRRSTLVQALTQAGFELVDIRYFSLPGALAWLMIARILGRQPTASSITAIYDRLGIPVLRRVEGRWRPPAGQSVLAIGRRPEV
jgi:glycosyltransferase involved in cell wall biosynthesis